VEAFAVVVVGDKSNLMVQ